LTSSQDFDTLNLYTLVATSYLNTRHPKSAMCHALKNFLSMIFWYIILAIAIIALIHTLVAVLALCAYACTVKGGVCIILFLVFMAACTIFGIAFFLFLCGIDVFGIDEAMPWVD